MKLFFGLIIAVIALLPLAMPDLVQAQSGVQIPNPINCDTINCLISQVIRYILGTIALIATGMMIWGGILMMTAAGNADKVKKAKETITWAVIGIIVIILSWSIIKFVLESIVTIPEATVDTALGCCVHAGPPLSCDISVTAGSCNGPGTTFVPGNSSCSGLGCP